MTTSAVNPTFFFNCTTNIVGGGVKNSALFIQESLKSHDPIDWYYVISKEVADILSKRGVGLNEKFSVFEKSPAKSSYSREKLLKLVMDLKPVLIYTMAGPAYMKFPVYHVQGLSNAYITHAKLSDYNLERNLVKRARLLFNSKLRLFYSKRSDFFIFQTEEARLNYCKRSEINVSNTAVIDNAVDEDQVRIFKNNRTRKWREDGKVVIFCPGAAYIHKGFQFIPEIAQKLSEKTDSPFEFVLTLSESNVLESIKKKAAILGIESHIKNIGPYHYSQLPEVYKNSDIVFVPSLLETFSATYLEAMGFKTILVVANKGFAREICGDAAIYVNPLDSTETANTFSTILENPTLFESKIRLGESILKKYGNQQQRYRKIIDLLISKYKENTHHI